MPAQDPTKCDKCEKPYDAADIDGGRCTGCGTMIVGEPPEPDYCTGCQEMGPMTLRRVDVNGVQKVAWICDDCGYAHIYAP